MPTITIKPKDLGTALKAIELGIAITLDEQSEGEIKVSGEAQSLFNFGIICGFENLKKELALTS